MSQFRRSIIFLFPLFLSITMAACSGNADQINEVFASERADDMTLGSSKASVFVIEYGSLTCPHCATFHRDVFQGLKSKYIDTGKVRFVFRQIPTAPLPLAIAGEILARCAGVKGAEKYYDMLEILFEKQRHWVTSTNPRLALAEIATIKGVSEAQYEACIQDQSHITRIQDVGDSAKMQYQINSTPSIVINGLRVLPGNSRKYTLEALSAAIDAQLDN